MSERSFNVSGIVKIEDAEVISVEKGNVEKGEVPIESRVCAFSMKVEGSNLPVKVILKGNMAHDIWRDELSLGKSANYPNSKTLVSMQAEVREVRLKEFVVHRPKEIHFYKVRTYNGDTANN